MRISGKGVGGSLVLYLGPQDWVMAMRARMMAVLHRLPRPWLLKTRTTVRPRKFFRLLWLLARSLAELDACAHVHSCIYTHHYILDTPLTNYTISSQAASMQNGCDDQIFAVAWQLGCSSAAPKQTCASSGMGDEGGAM